MKKTINVCDECESPYSLITIGEQGGIHAIHRCATILLEHIASLSQQWCMARLPLNMNR